MDELAFDGLIERLNGGDVDAAERAFLAYAPYLRMAVRRHLNGRLRSKLDSMDILQSVWADLLDSFRDARWHFDDRRHLKAFLVRAAKNRLIDRQRQYRRVLGSEQPLAGSPSADVEANDPRPSEVAQGRELWERILAQCSPPHREILNLRRQGFSLEEIAERTGFHKGSIRRILYDQAKRLASASRSGRDQFSAPNPGPDTGLGSRSG